MEEAITNLCYKQWSKLPPYWDSISCYTCKIRCSPNTMHMLCVCVCGKGGINALEFRQGSMKRNYMMELMSQGHGDVKAGEIGHSRNKTRMEKQTLDEADSKYRGKGVIELER